MNPQKTILNGQEYELISAEVVGVDFSGNDKEKLYTIYCRIMGAYGSQAAGDIIQARALDANIKNIPIAGEVVMLMKGPTAYNSAGATGQEYYYTNPVSVQSSVHHNGIPGVTEYLPNTKPSNSTVRQNARDGISNKASSRLKVKTTIDPAFPERLDVYPVQPYSGDIILEGRWGQSIRFGSTVDERRTYPIKPWWKQGLGQIGNPILIISNGTNPEQKPFNEFILENPDEDDSTIWMTSGQSVRFTPASSYSPSITDKGINLYKKNEYGGNQVIIASDRLIFNARKQELLAFSKEGIGLSSEKAISIDGKQVVEMESARINLGINALSPALLGDRSMDWLNDLCNILIKTLNSISGLTVPTGVGPSGIPINVAEFISRRSEISLLQQKIEKLQSRLVFLNENSSGPSADAKSSADERTNNDELRKEGEVPPRTQNSPNETAFSPRIPQTQNSIYNYLLIDPSGKWVYGSRSNDSITWKFDKAWSNYINTGVFDDSEIIEYRINFLNGD
jgi:hypothetical protein